MRCPASQKRLGEGGAPPQLCLWPKAQAACLNSLLNKVRQKAKEPRALDRTGELALLLGGNCGDPAWHHLAALGHVALQQLHVLIVDLRRLIAGEGAGLAPAVEGAPRRALRHAHVRSSSVSVPASSGTSMAAGGLRAPNTRAGWSRGPR